MKIFTLKKHHIYIFILLTVVITGIIILKDPGAEKTASVSFEPPLPTLIIDPGHGGEDGGAISVTGTKESEINLDIAKKLAAIMDLYGKTYRLTRTTEKINYPDVAVTVKSRKKADQDARINLIENTENAVVISIHQNEYPDTEPFGAQVLFGKTGDSEQFASLMQELLIKVIDPENYRQSTPIPEDIYLFKNISCPAILIECGFLSNPAEAELLDNESYRTKIALTAAGGYIKYFTQEKQAPVLEEW